MYFDFGKFPIHGENDGEECRWLLCWQLFDNLRSEQPEFMLKVHAVSGDIAEEGLGLQDDQQAYLEDNVNVVFHSAATVRFNESLM